ncbi:hypothetical protein [Acidisphaera sp. L21]|uniref:hypothetical protein n=1 Tax=Acidisphaera sp. L21 TaxID=1641851 RepID=UPI00131E127F|nr:hypothetical protein [Acidisphaera sp. L21]
MQITAFGMLLIPFCLACAFSPELLLYLTILSGGFEAAASMIIGPLGLQPNILPAMLFMGHLVVLRMMGGRFVANAEVVRGLTPLLLFVALAVIGAFLLPTLFGGQAQVWPQKSEDHTQVLLSFSSANITQTLYLLIDIGFVYSSALYIASYPVRVRRLMTMYFASGVLVLVVSAWQLASRLTGIPFPISFFYSNPGIAVLYDQMMGSVPRTNGPFSEPSSLSTFLSGMSFAAGWLVLHGRGGAAVKWLLAGGVFGVLLSTATTGIGTLLIGAGLAGIYVVARAAPVVRQRFVRVAVPVVFFGFVTAIAAPIVFPSIVHAVNTVAEATLTKSDSSSYDDRTQADTASVMLLIPTMGLGAGWGSNRSSSLIPGLLASAGLPGLGLLIWAGLSLRREIPIMSPFLSGEDDAWALQAASAGLVGLLIAAVLSGPNIISLTFYGLLGAMYGILARARFATNQQSLRLRSQMQQRLHAEPARPFGANQA